MASGSRYIEPGGGGRSDGLRYLERRVREEAGAAVIATSTAATLIHIALATAYARRFGEKCVPGPSEVTSSWADEHRIW